MAPRHWDYNPLVIEPLHINMAPISLPVENFQLDQTFSPTYGQEDVYGRMDPIVTYKNTKRTISINFSCQSHHFFDAAWGVKNNIQAINMLTQMLYPSYQGTAKAGLGVLKAPPFFRILYGSYVGGYSSMGGMAFNSMGRDGLENQPLYNGLTGYITNFRHGIGKVARNMAYAPAENGTEGYHPVPREIKVSFTFNVVHDKEVGWRKVGKDYHFSEEGYGTNFPYNLGDPGPGDVVGDLVSDVLGPSDTDTGAGKEKPTVNAGGAANDEKTPKNSKTDAKAEVKKCKVERKIFTFDTEAAAAAAANAGTYGVGTTYEGGKSYSANVCKGTGKPAPQLVS
jgi:hypothetical protein